MAAVIRPKIAALMVSVRKISAATWRGENAVSNKWTIRSSAWLYDNESAALLKEVLEEHKLAELAGLLSTSSWAQACEELHAQEAAVEQHQAEHRAGEELLAEEAAVEDHASGQPAGEEMHAQAAAVEQHQAGHRAGEELLAEEAAVEQPQTDKEDMPPSDEDDSGFVAEGSDVNDDIAEIVSSAPPERDEAIDLCEDIDAREEGVIHLLNDDEDVPPVATLKQMFEDSVKHVHTFVEERIEQATWGGEQYRRVVPPAVDSEIGQVLKTLQLLDPTLQNLTVTRRELHPALEKVVSLNHTVNTPYIVQFLKAGINQPCDCSACKKGIWPASCVNDQDMYWKIIQAMRMPAPIPKLVDPKDKASKLHYMRYMLRRYNSLSLQSTNPARS
eukprot:jgi/Tetstr1/466179/TSEL_010739.t1